MQTVHVPRNRRSAERKFGHRAVGSGYVMWHSQIQVLLQIWDFIKFFILSRAKEIPVKAVPMKETQVNVVPMKAMPMKAFSDTPDTIALEDQVWEYTQCVDRISK